jgi:hypothetical protein
MKFEGDQSLCRRSTPCALMEVMRAWTLPLDVHSETTLYGGQIGPSQALLIISAPR